MNWKLKCMALYGIGQLPYGVEIHRWLQRRVTGRYFETVSDELLSAHNYHVQNFLSLMNSERVTALEFGSGRNLLTPLLLSAAGAREVYAYDIEKLATVEQVNDIIRQLRSHQIGGVDQTWREIRNIDTDLRRYYRINYCAPADARNTELPAGSVDFICSTSTLEHIGHDDIMAILRECMRIASPASLMSFIIDYHDHYATADPAITRFNFYRYSDFVWRFFNPSIHFQNRLRHSDYEDIFGNCGLAALERRPIIPPDSHLGLQDVPLSSKFLGYSAEDLEALNGFFLLKADEAGPSVDAAG